MRFAGLLVLMFSVALISGCVCTSANVGNRTHQPLFANTAYEEDGQLIEETGHLVSPGDDTEFVNYGETFIRVRDLAGTTVHFERLPENEDAEVPIESLEPLAGAPTPGAPSIGRLGPKSNTYLVTCTDGDEVKVPLFGTMVKVTNNSSEPLILSLLRHSGARRDAEVGTLATALGKAVLYESTTSEPWLVAHDAEGQLRFATALGVEGPQEVAIPRTLPSLVTVHESPYDNCGARSLLPWNW